MMRKYILKSLLIVVTLLCGCNLIWSQTQRPPAPTVTELQELLNEYSNRGNEQKNEIDNIVDKDRYRIIKFEYEGTQWIIDVVWLYNVNHNNDTWGKLGVNSDAANRMTIEAVYQNPLGNSKKIIYATPGETKTLNIQIGDGSENLDGFIYWHDNDAKIINDSQRGWLRDRMKFINGFAWVRGIDNDYFKLCIKYDGRKWVPYNNNWLYSEYVNVSEGDESSSEEASSIQYTIPTNAVDGQIYTIVCEASASNDVTVVPPGDNHNGTLTTPKIAVKHIFEIHVITSPRRTNEFVLVDEKLSIDPESGKLSQTIKDQFLEKYEIHTPITNGTNYRLAEDLENYYISVNGTLQSPNWVRWKPYNQDGTPVSNNNSSVVIQGAGLNISKYTFPFTETNRQYTYYLTAEVGYSANENAPTKWFPVSILTVYLDPYTEAVSSEDLKKTDYTNNVNYQLRYQEYLDLHKYEVIDSITFDAGDENKIDFTTVTSETNFPSVHTEPDIESFYGYADLSATKFSDRKNNRLSVGRGEYALYRTLNYAINDGNISKDKVTIGEEQGEYFDYFVNSYNKWVIDRTYEKTDGDKVGYFMYLDATDDPGVIARIPVSGLCPSSTLLVSAWICDLAHKENENDPSRAAEHADVGFTLKKIKRDATGSISSEEILTKYYTGAVGHPKEEGDRALWQQVFFKFVFDEGLYSDEYMVEIANNTPKSNGADYAIDDIFIYKSTPDISVQREDACDASTLIVSSDYPTLQQNMGWDLKPDVLDNVGDKINDLDYRKFRYGLMGPDPTVELDQLDEIYRCLGNVYFGFVEDPTITGEDPKDWITVNKQVETILPEKFALYKSIRVAVPTNYVLGSDNPDNPDNPLISTDISGALRREYILNVRAIHDFLADVEKQSWSITDELKNYLSDRFNKLWDNASKDVAIDKIMADPTGLGVTYEEAVVALFNYLGIPRIRCPWMDPNGIKINLDAINVSNTDLKFAGEIYKDDQGQTKTATGKYWVVLFSATDVAAAADASTSEENRPAVVVNAECTLKSEFYVVPSITIAVDTETEAGGITCVGSIHTLDATLMVANVDDFGNLIDANMIPFDKKYEGHSYTFDWFLGSEEEYKSQMISGKDLQTIIKDLRTSLGNSTGSFGVDDVNSSKLSSDEKQLLIDLLGDEDTPPQLVTGKEVSFRWVKQVVAIPYVPDIITEEDSNILIKMFCTDPQELTLDAESNVPELSLGFSGVTYPDVTYPDDVKLFNAPLRLGLRHVQNGVTLNGIPIREDIEFGVLGSDESSTKGMSLQEIPDKKMINLWESSNKFTPVAELINLYVDKAKSTDFVNQLSLKFNTDYSFEEGKVYSLYIPFGEYDGYGENATLIPNSCEGYAILDIKIVPEYLTWTGHANGVWYNDNNWKQSTKKVLYKDDQADTDANGSDPDLTKAFAPLYFTKVTVPNTSVLPLLEEKEVSGTDKTLNLVGTKESGGMGLTGATDADPKSGFTPNIQYDMAVDGKIENDTDNATNWSIVPYYGNKVDQIYFKPEAQMQRQQHLTYNTARVEFEMIKDAKYWMASPLKDVFAGDMYAPKETAIQNTYAFEDINYSEKAPTEGNDRQNPAFYQKAWDKGVNIYTNEAGDEYKPYSVVKSNWSVEYNDVNVPYALGKGFYASVEDFENTEGEEDKALVRLPKADVSYTYEALKTKATPNLSKTNGGKLADETEITVILSNSDDAASWREDNNTIADGDGTHFLLGNPYMYPLSLENFLEGNKDVLADKFWTLKDGTATVGTPDLESGWKNGEDLDEIAPMQAFFVELTTALEEDATKEVTFTPDMMVGETYPSTTTHSSVTASHPVLRLTAEKGETRSIAFLTLRDDASNGYESDKDAITLLDSELTEIPQVYSVAGDQAAGVNAVKRIDNIPLGVYAANDKEETTLTIEGITNLPTTLYLYDAKTKENKALTGDSHTLHLTGSSHGRYFLRSDENPTGNEAIDGEAISIYSAVAGEVIVSATDLLERIQVVAPSGQVVRSFSPKQAVYSFNLPQGIYVIHAECHSAMKTAKLQVR